MKFFYHSKNWKIEKKFQWEIEKKMNFLEKKYNFLDKNDELHLHFELFKELKCSLKAEMLLNKHSKPLNVHTESENIYTAIHQIFNKINLQLLKIKEKSLDSLKN